MAADFLGSNVFIYVFERTRQALQRVRAFPFSGEEHLYGTRRMLVHGFPYAVIYRIENPWITIIAVSHLSREEGYWAR